jgi:acyl carrier protein
MIPGWYVEMAEMPLTANGKVDRRALPAPELGERGEGERGLTPTEEIVAGIWAEVLKLERVGAEENFFELGGHSLMATQVVSRIRDSFGVELSLQRSFENQTVASLASVVEELLVKQITQLTSEEVQTSLRAES